MTCIFMLLSDFDLFVCLCPTFLLCLYFAAFAQSGFVHIDYPWWFSWNYIAETLESPDFVAFESQKSTKTAFTTKATINLNIPTRMSSFTCSMHLVLPSAELYPIRGLRFRHFATPVSLPPSTLAGTIRAASTRLSLRNVESTLKVRSPSTEFKAKYGAHHLTAAPYAGGIHVISAVETVLTLCINRDLCKETNSVRWYDCTCPSLRESMRARVRLTSLPLHNNLPTCI